MCWRERRDIPGRAGRPRRVLALKIFQRGASNPEVMFRRPHFRIRLLAQPREGSVVDAANPGQPSCPSSRRGHLRAWSYCLSHCGCAAAPLVTPERQRANSSRPPWATQGDVQGDTQAEDVTASQTAPWRRSRRRRQATGNQANIFALVYTLQWKAPIARAWPGKQPV